MWAHIAIDYIEILQVPFDDRNVERMATGVVLPLVGGLIPSGILWFEVWNDEDNS